jgi:hypothetical protein
LLLQQLHRCLAAPRRLGANLVQPFGDVRRRLREQNTLDERALGILTDGHRHGRRGTCPAATGVAQAA